MNVLRLLAAFSLGVAIPHAAAASPWQSAVAGPRGLPGVEIQVGYPDGYVSTRSSPVTLRVRAGDRPFDGYVAFHIGRGQSRATNHTVMTRVALRPQSEHRFNTWLATGFADPERTLVIEWYSPSRRLLGSADAGVPPWQPARPLVLPASDLGTHAQWYAGFSRVVTPLDHWFELPMPVREAIFHSGVHVVFAGLPSRVPQMTELDRALIPIDAQGMGLGSKIVSNGIATFVADEEILRDGLPWFRAEPIRERRFDAPVERSPRAGEIFREMRPLLLAVLMLPLPFAGWIAMRRRPRWTAIAIIIVATLALVVARDSILTRPHEFRSTMLRMLTPGVYDTIVADTDSGPSPIRARSAAGPQWTTSNWPAAGDMEVRASETLPGFGDMYANRGWSSTVRKARTRSLGTPATIRSRPSGHDTLIVEYDATMPVDYVRASWICGDRRCTGTAHAGGQKSGRATVRNGVQSWSCLDCLFQDSAGERYVDLIHMTSEGATAIRATEPPVTTMTPPYLFDVPLEWTGTVLRGVFVLPPGPTGKLKFITAIPARITRDGATVTITLESPQHSPKSVRILVEEAKS